MIPGSAGHIMVTTHTDIIITHIHTGVIMGTITEDITVVITVVIMAVITEGLKLLITIPDKEDLLLQLPDAGQELQ